MAKLKTTFFCQNCGTQYAKWQGQCNACKEWNTIAEEIIQKEEKTAWKPSATENKRVSKPLKINEIDSTQEVRMDTTDSELNRVLGGGIVRARSSFWAENRALERVHYCFKFP